MYVVITCNTLKNRYFLLTTSAYFAYFTITIYLIKYAYIYVYMLKKYKQATEFVRWFILVSKLKAGDFKLNYIVVMCHSLKIHHVSVFPTIVGQYNCTKLLDRVYNIKLAIM